MIRNAVLAALIALAAWAPAAGAHGIGDGPGAFDYAPPAPGTYRLPPIREAADGRVLDATGTARRLRSVMGDGMTVLSFVSTRCTDAKGCPLATAVLHQVRAAAARDARLARGLKLVTLSFDLAHDTPAVLARYREAVASGTTAGPAWEFVVPAGERELASILDAYGQTIQRAGGDAVAPTHLLRVYLIDGQGRIRNIYGLDFLDPRLLLNDARTLLREAPQARR
jgi:cytochrome oxidase Cu insertion factor (SCO1/SenC/PrrC family)